ncbi:lanthionine synthetase LanC family protein [Nocardioides silvaticus]|uniref:lanthionine synthetase LanC family protein n=1 Tax=Nocardioides silvaticus TaxID=2201891 RepID=UPI001B86CEEA|nr:lanthionine synthetase LanC family protein [Nocardioides silvaticus]
MTSAAAYVQRAEAAWSWVLRQVRWDSEGPWIPESVVLDGPRATEPPELRTGLHSGIGGLALVLAEIRLGRDWTGEEAELAAGIASQVRARTATETEVSYFDGLVSALTVLLALGEPGADAVVARLLELATGDGWATPWAGPPTYSDDARINDVTLGTAGVLLGAVWALRVGVPGSADLASCAAGVLLREAEETEHGPRWLFVPRRFRETPPTEMPGWSHGQAGITAALAVAGAVLDRHDLRDAARGGAERLVAIGEHADGTFVVPRYVPQLPSGDDPVSFGWCHGAAGTAQVFPALELAGVDDVAGRSPHAWGAAAWLAVRSSGLPERLEPGFWDNDGRCCGTAGVGDLALDRWQRYGDEEDLRFARILGDALVARACGDDEHRWWQFVEHRAEQPLLDPGVGWMQGAAGIAAYLFRLGRVLEEGPDASAVQRTDSWWAVRPA